VLARALCDTRARDGVSFSPSSSKSTPDLRGPAFGNIAPDRRFAVAFDAAFDRRRVTATVRGLEFPGFERAVVFEPRSDQVRRVFRHDRGIFDPDAELSVSFQSRKKFGDFGGHVRITAVENVYRKNKKGAPSFGFKKERSIGDGLFERVSPPVETPVERATRR
jgi:hypothetical protein